MTNGWTRIGVPAKVARNQYLNNRDNWVTAFDRIFDDMFKDGFPEINKSFGIQPFSKTAYPKVNVAAYDDRVEIEAEVAGYSKENINVEVEDSILYISGNTSTNKETGDSPVYILRELKRSTFSRSFVLSEELLVDEIEAVFDNGILTLTIPRKVEEPQETKVKKVTIK